jgi:PAS domain S-box-containing protein
VADASKRLISPRLPLLHWTVTFAAVCASGVFCFALPRLGGRATLVLLPSGIAVAALCRWGRRMWPAVLLGGLGIELAEREPLVTALCVGGGLVLAALATCWLLDRGGFEGSFGRARDMPIFILAAGLGMVIAPTLGYVGFYLGAGGRLHPDAAHWIRWWANTTVGVLLVSPALIEASRESLRPLLERRGEVLIWFIGVLVCCAAILWGTGDLGRPAIGLFALILIVMGTIRLGLVISAAGAFLLSAVTVVSFSFGIGVFGNLYELQGLVITWTLIAALNFVCLSITALLAQRDSAAQAKLRAEHRYAQIFEGSPQPIWVHDRDSLRFLMINGAALRQYGWSREEILSMSVAALIPPGEPSAAPLDEQGHALGTAAEPFETRHLTRDGRVLEVEVWTRSIEFDERAAELVFALDVSARRAFGRALMDAIAGEQRRIGQEMHDGLGQELTGLALSVRALANRAARERDAIAADLEQLAALATSCIRDARLIVQGLSPLTDADGNLDKALASLAERSSLSGTPVRFHARHDGELHLELKVRNHLYRIAQEAVQNALKHSGASAVEIELSRRDGMVRLGVLDDGRGMPADAPGGVGLGMRTMRFRSSAIGARLQIGKRAGGGNAVICEVLCRGDDEQPRERQQHGAVGG